MSLLTQDVSTLNNIYNPIQLAAISNLKLAQLTFAPPDLHSLRKTAVIKNMTESVYSNTPAALLQPMTRWQFFTPESLEKMTQEGLEEIFSCYAQTIEKFRPAKLSMSNANLITKDIYDDLVNEENNWSNSSIFSQPNTTTESVDKKRLSWTSDTGLISGAVSQNLANEIMSLFDMDFSVDIKVDTAPKLPELSFKRRAKARLSQDMLTSLLPAFEKIAIENSNQKTYTIKSPPQRSSSLRHLEKRKKEEYPLSPPITPVENNTMNFNKKVPVEEDENRQSTSTTASSWSYLSDRKEKPLPETPHHEAKHKHTKRKRKSAVKMEKTVSKRQSASKSKFVKIGRQKKEDKKAQEVKPEGFVKRVASFMKSRTNKSDV